MENHQLDEVLNKISLSFGAESVKLIIPSDLLVNMSLYRVSSIDKNNLDDEITFHSKIYSLFATLLAYVSDKYSIAESGLKKLEAQLALHYEKKLIESDERATDKKIDKLVECDDVYIDSKNSTLECKNYVMIFANVLKSLEVKHDMLLQLTAKRRQEMKQGI